MLKHFPYFCLLLLLFLGCKTLSTNGNGTTYFEHNVHLGHIGLEDPTIFENHFNNTSIPTYSEPLKLSVKPVQFTKKSYKAFVKAQLKQRRAVQVTFVDSLELKPMFLELQIADVTGLVNALNDSENNDVKTYLSNTPNATLISNISIAFNSEILDKVINAESVFLVPSGLKNYGLKVITQEKPDQFISFNKGVVFAYNSSMCCWKENNKHQIQIVDLVNYFNDCPNSTYRSAQRAKKVINYHKL